MHEYCDINIVEWTGERFFFASIVEVEDWGGSPSLAWHGWLAWLVDRSAGYGNPGWRVKR